MKTKHFFCLLSLTLAIASCQAPNDDIFILYDNDVHCAVEGYEKMAALRADYLKQSIYVNVISCGDFAQGNIVGSISKGKYPVAIMNSVPYDYTTLGNHEFDYGMPQLKKMMRWMRAKCLCCNLTYLPTGKNLFPAFNVRTFGTTRVAFIGVSTPTTLTNSMPINFYEDSTLVYDFHAQDIVQVVQQTVNSARMEDVNYVVLLSHLGDDTRGINSLELIRQTTGIDAVLDGHAHHVINTRIANLNGDSVILASTGSNFKYIGCLQITEAGEIHNSLIDASQYEGTNKRVHSKVESILNRVQDQTCQKLGYSEITLTDLDSMGVRLVRKGETNLGDFVSDAFRVISQSDIGMVTGGGLRSSLPEGDITFGSLLQVMPFNNELAKIQLTGAQLLDNLEIAVSAYSKESGDFMHVSGLRYTFDPAICSPVVYNSEGLYDSINGKRRIVSADVWRDSVWIPVHADSVYTIGGQNYSLLCGGTVGMFQGAVPVPTVEMLDIEVVELYLNQLGDTIRRNQYAEQQDRITIL